MEEVLRHEMLALSRKSYADAKSAPRCVGWARGTVYYGGDRKIAVFRLNEKVLDFIRTAQESVFAWQEPDSPVEDLHFFRTDRTVVFSSTAHEGFGTIALEDDDLERMPFLKKRIDLRHPAALELLPAAERERVRFYDRLTLSS